MAKQIVLVTSASRYSFTPKDEPGRLLEGVKVNYLDISNEAEKSQDRSGFALFTENLPLTAWPEAANAPGIYEMTFTSRPGEKGRATQRAQAVRFLRAVELPMADTLPPGNDPLMLAPVSLAGLAENGKKHTG